MMAIGRFRWLGLVLALAGCEATELPVQDSIPLLRMRSELTRALCERTYQACECEWGTRYDNELRCGTEVELLVIDIRERLDGVLGEGLVYDGECVAQYVDQLDALECGTEPLDAGECQPPCQLIHGWHVEGESCRLDGRVVNDCVRGLECIGTCTDPCTGGDGFYVAEGESCDAPDRQCAPGLGCTDAGVCRALPEPGEPCFRSECAAGAYCELEVIGDPTSLERCFALGEVGDPCRGHDQCAAGECPNGFCASPSGEGTPCIAACGPGFDCVVGACVVADAVLCSWELPEIW